MNMQEYINSEARRRTILLGIIKSPQVCQGCMLSLVTHKEKKYLISSAFGGINFFKTNLRFRNTYVAIFNAVCLVCMHVCEAGKSTERSILMLSGTDILVVYLLFFPSFPQSPASHLCSD